MIRRFWCRYLRCFPIGGRTVIVACRTDRTARWSLPCASRNRTSWVPLDCTSAIMRAMVVAVLGQAIDAAADQKSGPEIFGQAVELVDVAFPVADMHAALGRPCQLGGKAQIVEPAHTFLLFDRHPGRIDLALERGGSLELAARPEFRRRQPERQTIRRDGHAGMHQEPADRMLPVATFLQLAPGRHIGKPDLVLSRAFEGELSGVMQDQDGTAGCPDTQGRGGEMTLQDLVLADIPVGKEAVGGLGVRPVLERRRRGFPRTFT